MTDKERLIESKRLKVLLKILKDSKKEYKI